jgi:hypothetical protein
VVERELSYPIGREVFLFLEISSPVRILVSYLHESQDYYSLGVSERFRIKDTCVVQVLCCEFPCDDNRLSFVCDSDRVLNFPLGDYSV